MSDAVRFVILHKYGGMYIDTDILLLRDLQPFYTHEFAYRWSKTKEFNTAILRLYPQSNISSKLLNLGQKYQKPYIFFPPTIRSYLDPIILNRLPCVFFDPLWLVADKADPKTKQLWNIPDNPVETFKIVFNKKNELSQKGRTAFDGAFAFHWHSLHRAGMLEQGSYLYQWNEFLKSELLEKI